MKDGIAKAVGKAGDRAAMVGGREPAAPPRVVPEEVAERGEEKWWPVALAIVVTVVLHVALPGKYGHLPILVPRRAQGQALASALRWASGWMRFGPGSGQSNLVLPINQASSTKLRGIAKEGRRRSATGRKGTHLGGLVCG